jgi:uncharacterized metal-binding protein YceD (DUF177 family)
MIIEVNKLIGHKLRVMKQIPVGLRWKPRDGAIYAETISADLRISATEYEVSLTGSFATDLLATCDRTLRRFTLPVSGEIDLKFRSNTELNKKSEVELDSEDLNVSFHSGTINLIQVLNEAVLLELPMKVLSPDVDEEFSASFGVDEEEQIDERFSVLLEMQERMKKREE